MREQNAVRETRYDIVIIGGGLAGLSAASTILKGSDATIALVEGRGIGSNSPTPMTFIDVVERFGLEAAVAGKYRRFLFHSPLGSKSMHGFNPPQLVVLDYQAACRGLLRRSQAAGDIQLMLERAVTLERTRDARWRIALDSGDVITAPLVVDASGQALFAIRELGLPGPRMFSHCFGQVYSDCTTIDLEEGYFLAPTDRFGDGGGWFYPLSDGRVSFGYATLRTMSRFPAEIVRERYFCALHEFKPYSDYLAQAELDHDEWGSIPVLPPRRIVYPGLLLVGDAAGLATIWSCMGTEPALVSGTWAGEAALDAHRQQDYSFGALSSYQRRWKSTYGRFYRQGAVIAPVMWRQTEQNWDQQIPACQQLTSEQMLARLRTNWPFSQWWRAWFVRLYDLAGRVRRGIVAWLRKRTRSSG